MRVRNGHQIPGVGVTGGVQKSKLVNCWSYLGGNIKITEQKSREI